MPDWLTVDWVLEQFGPTRRRAVQAYREFVSEGIRQPSSPWEQVVGQVYLRSPSFIKRVARASQGSSDREIPRAQRKPAWLSAEEVLRRITREYGLSAKDFLRPTRRPSEARQVAIYGLRRYAGLRLGAIGDRLGLGYTAVSRRVGAVDQQLREHLALRRRVLRMLGTR